MMDNNEKAIIKKHMLMGKTPIKRKRKTNKNSKNQKNNYCDDSDNIRK